MSVLVPLVRKGITFNEVPDKMAVLVVTLQNSVRMYRP